MSLIEKKKELDKLEEGLRAARNKKFTLDEEIRNAVNKKFKIEEDTIQSIKDLNVSQDKLKVAQVNLENVKFKTRSILSEANETLISAQDFERQSKVLVDQRQKELDALDRDKNIAMQAKKRMRENIEKGKLLDRQTKEMKEKIKEYGILIGKQKDVDLLKDSLLVEKADIDEVVEDNKRKSKIIDASFVKAGEDRQSLKIEIRRYAKTSKEKEDAAIVLRAKIMLKDKELSNIEKLKTENKKRDDKVIDAMETRRRILETRENKVKAIIEKIKKDKNLEDDVKAIGL